MPPCPTPRGAVLDPPTVEHLDFAGVHANRDRDFEDPLGGDDSLDQTFVQAEQVPGRLDERSDMQPRIEFVRVASVGRVTTLSPAFNFVKASLLTDTSVGEVCAVFGPVKVA